MIDIAAIRARYKGPTAYANLLTVRRDVLEGTVLGALRERLMAPELFREFVAEFTTTWKQLQAEASAGLNGNRQELTRVQGQIERAVDAIVTGMASASLKQRLEELERRKALLEAVLANAEIPAPRLHRKRSLSTLLSRGGMNVLGQLQA